MGVESLVLRTHTLTAFKVKLRGSPSSPALRATLGKVALQSLLWDGQLPAYSVWQWYSSGHP